MYAICCFNITNYCFRKLLDIKFFLSIKSLLKERSLEFIYLQNINDSQTVSSAACYDIPQPHYLSDYSSIWAVRLEDTPARFARPTPSLPFLATYYKVKAGQTSGFMSVSE